MHFINLAYEEQWYNILFCQSTQLVSFEHNLKSKKLLVPMLFVSFSSWLFFSQGLVSHALSTATYDADVTVTRDLWFNDIDLYCFWTARWKFMAEIKRLIKVLWPGWVLLLQPPVILCNMPENIQTKLNSLDFIYMHFCKWSYILFLHHFYCQIFSLPVSNLWNILIYFSLHLGLPHVPWLNILGWKASVLLFA